MAISLFRTDQKIGSSQAEMAEFMTFLKETKILFLLLLKKCEFLPSLPTKSRFLIKNRFQDLPSLLVRCRFRGPRRSSNLQIRGRFVTELPEGIPKDSRRKLVAKLDPMAAIALATLEVRICILAPAARDDSQPARSVCAGWLHQNKSPQPPAAASKSPDPFNSEACR